MNGYRVVLIARWLPIAFLLTLTMGCCKKDDHSCTNVYPTTARFKIEQELNNGDAYVLCDTCISNSFIKFTVLDPLALQVSWILTGSSQVKSGKSCHLFFDRKLSGKSVDVTAVVKKLPDLECYPLDDGIDTITKTVWFVDESQSKIWGSYEGYNTDDPGKKFDIEVNYQDTQSIPITNHTINNGCLQTTYPLHKLQHYAPVALNLPCGCDWEDRQSLPVVFASYNHFYIKDAYFSNECRNISGLGELNPANPNQITIHYSLYNGPGGPRVQKVFKGTRK